MSLGRLFSVVLFIDNIFGDDGVDGVVGGVVFVEVYEFDCCIVGIGLSIGGVGIWMWMVVLLLVLLLVEIVFIGVGVVLMFLCEKIDEVRLVFVEFGFWSDEGVLVWVGVMGKGIFDIGLFFCWLVLLLFMIMRFCCVIGLVMECSVGVIWCVFGRLIWVLLLVVCCVECVLICRGGWWGIFVGWICDCVGFGIVGFGGRVGLFCLLWLWKCLDCCWVFFWISFW